MQKRIIAGILAAFMTLSIVISPTGESITYAADTEKIGTSIETIEEDSVKDTEEAQENELVEDTEEVKNTEVVEDTEEVRNTEVVEDTEEVKNTEVVEDTEEVRNTELVEDTEEVKNTEEVEETEGYLIQYLMLNSDKISLNETQNVVVGFNCSDKITEAVLNYRNKDTGAKYSQKNSEITDGALLFEMKFSDEQMIGTYELTSIEYKIDENVYVQNFSEAGIDARFGVEENVQNNPDAYIEDEKQENIEDDVDIVRVDEDGNTVSEQSLSDAIGNAIVENENEISTYNLEERSIKRDIVVVLDPGHDSTHVGASANGLREEVLNLKIASYCKEALEQYSGVKVYMTRNTESCPYPGTTSGVDNENRVKFAANVGADIYVSIHNNSSSSSQAHGAMVFYPNSNYNNAVSQEGKGVAEAIEKHLVALGLYNRGITIRNANEDKYPDGSAADYYGVIRNAKLVGIPAIIVEHAFVTSNVDANGFLDSDLKLKKLGEADASAIAEYYGLGKSVNITSDGVKIANVNEAEGTALMSAWNVQPVDKVKKVSFAVWSKSDQSDLKWYEVNNTGSTTYAAEMNISNHNYNVGTYYVNAYATDIYGKAHYLGGKTFEINTEKANVVATGDATEAQYTITANNVNVAGGVKEVQFAVWSQKNGQDDLIWYTAKNISGNIWQAAVPIGNHKTDGTYNVDAYAINKGGNAVYLSGTTFEVSGITAKKIVTKNVDEKDGQFDVEISDISSKSGVAKIDVGVWSKEDHSDIFWYTATRQSDGNYLAHVNIANHKYNYGSYSIDVYGTTTTGIFNYLGGTSQSINMPKAQISASGNKEETKYDINIETEGVLGGIGQIQVAVWSKQNGQDDLVWYNAVKQSDKIWKTEVSISNHKTEGIYYADVYAIRSDGQANYLGGTTFEVTGIKTQGIIVSREDDRTGQFDALIKSVQTPSGIAKIEVGVWSKEDHSNIHWYNAIGQENGDYLVNGNIANHQYRYGKYFIDVYATTNTGIQKYLGGTTVQINVPKAQIEVSGNSDESQFKILAQDVGIDGGIKNVQVAIWSKLNGQDDLIWYTASNIADGVWSANAVIEKHKTVGLYYADVYAISNAGDTVYLGGTTFNVNGIDMESVQISSINKNEGTFSVVSKGIKSKGKISSIQVAAWSKEDHSDLYWYNAVGQENGTYIVDANIANHQYDYGKYYIDVYGNLSNGVTEYLGGTSVEISRPKAVITSQNNENQTWYTITASNVGPQGSIKQVQIAVWSLENGQDDLVWYDAQNIGSENWKTSIQIARHKTAGTYNADVYVIGTNGSVTCIGSTTFYVDKPTVENVNIIDRNEPNGTFGVQVSGIHAKAGVNKIQIAVWSSKNQNDLRWYDAMANGDGTYKINVSIVDHQKNTGLYYADAYLIDNNGIQVYAGGTTCSMVNVTSYYHPIEGNASVTIQQMVDYYRARAAYPSFYANTEASTIEAFCRIYQEECQAEGIRAEVAFCQAMKETGFLRYGGNVKIEQYNFAGMGSTGAGVAGERYPDVRTGIRAQVQHLKAYANNDPLKNACVDSRFKYVSRGTAPYVEWLGIQENPYHKGWATAKKYGYDIVGMINNLKTY